jgi:uncharacterized protein (UPF0371 family)
MYRIGFDNDKYLQLQSENIRERINKFGNKLYLEFGGKLFDDFHASRVFPGFQPDSKIRLLQTLADQTEIVLVINASDIEQNRVQGDYGITYDDDLLRLIDAFRSMGLFVGSVVITQYSGQESAAKFRQRLRRQDVTVFLHYPIENYPSNVPLIVSDQGFGRNDYIQTSRPLVVVTAPGSSSGKMATCLSQLYHEFKRGVKAGYAKFETFPVWNLPLGHAVNLAYEAATTDINDVNMIDPYHLSAYNVSAVNYNRDVEVFPILNAIFRQIWGASPYQSPTDMGVNMIGCCISDDEVCQEASKQEIIRRYYQALCEERMTGGMKTEIQKLELLMNTASVSADDRTVAIAARAKASASESPSVAIELPDGHLITGKTSSLLGASAAALLNALKTLAGINDEVRLISPIMIEPIQRLKLDFLGNSNPRLHTDEVLIALSMCAATNPTAELVMAQIPKLRNSEAHSTVILSQVDVNVFRKLGVNITCEPQYQSKRLYHKK